jgi:hypothetical protein
MRNVALLRLRSAIPGNCVTIGVTHICLVKLARSKEVPVGELISGFYFCLKAAMIFRTMSVLITRRNCFGFCQFGC